MPSSIVGLFLTRDYGVRYMHLKEGRTHRLRRFVSFHYFENFRSIPLFSLAARPIFQPETFTLPVINSGIL